MKDDNDNNKSNKRLKREEQQQQEEEEPQPLVRACEACGHLVPVANLEVHRAACLHNHRHDRRREHGAGPPQGRHTVNNGAATTAAVTEPTGMDTTVCEKCGKRIPTANEVVHNATCHSKTETGQDGGSGDRDTSDNDRNENRVSSLEAPTSEPPTHVEVVEQEGGIETTLAGTIPPNGDGTSARHEEEGQEGAPQQQWSCPRCTLINPASASHCEVCRYSGPRRLASNDPSEAPPGAATQNHLRLEVSEVPSSVVNATGSAITIGSFSLLGALLGGPMGAVMGGVAGATVDGMTRFNSYQAHQQRQQQQQQQRENPSAARPSRGGPRFAFTTVTHTPFGGTTVSVTTSNDNSSTGMGGLRTVRVSGPGLDQMTEADRRILQMLLLNAMAQMGGNHHAVDQMSYEELLERFGVGNENRRGASEETINALPLTTLDTQALQELKENQTSCNICLQDFQKGEQVRKLGCDHMYHRACIDRWLSQVASCPICKKSIGGNSDSSERNGPDASQDYNRPRTRREFWD